MNTKELICMLENEKSKGIQVYTSGENEKRVNIDAFLDEFVRVVNSDINFRWFFWPTALYNNGYAPTLAEQINERRTHNTLSAETYKYIYSGKQFGGFLTNELRIESMIDDNLYVNRSGRFMMRLNKEYHKRYGVNMPDKFISIMGSKLNNLTLAPCSYTFDITNDFDWSDGEFGKHGSCWFPGGAYSESLPTFQNGGGWAIRFYRADVDKDWSKSARYDRGYARTWIYPGNDSLIIFNTYGNEVKDVNTVLKYVLSQYTNKDTTLTKISLINSEDGCRPYINGGSAYAISESYKWDESERFDLDMEVIDCEDDDDYFICESCGHRVHADDTYSCEGDILCERCYGNNASMCARCNSEFYIDNMTHMEDSDSYYCSHCLERISYIVCESCGDHFENEDNFNHANDTDNVYCEDCASDNLTQCETCGDMFENTEDVDGNSYCEDCAIAKREDIEEERNA